MDFDLCDEISEMEKAAAGCGQTAVLECIFTHIKDLVEIMIHGHAVRLAVRNGHIDAVRMILRHSIIPDSESLADTALDGLDESIICDNMEALDYFLTSGCPAWDLRAGNNDDALEFIFRHGSDEVIAHVAKHPALRGSPLLHEGMELLVYRCREDLVEVLLAHGGVDINWRNFGGESMLSIAKCGEYWEIVEFLISKGAHE